MKRFKFFTPYWWVLHIVMLIFFFWLGHAVHFR